MSPRPKSDSSKNHRLNVRLSSEMEKKLEYCSEKLQISKTEVVQRGIDLVKNELDKR